jgi:hypothetical protein
MKTRSKVTVNVLAIVVLIALVVVFFFPQFAATRYSYFDVNNGRIKLDWVSFGRVYRESVEDTEYSKLLKNLGFEEMRPEWKLATQRTFGVLRFFGTQYVDYYEGGIVADCKVFAVTVELNKIDPSKSRDLTAHFRSLVQKGDPSEVREFVSHLPQGK